jgi:L-ascorbate metabolism protein UlaG (beta-lactamase superfamily)
MNITWYGHACFKIQTKPSRGSDEITIFTDPFDKSIGLRPPQGNANIVTISHSHHDHNNVSALKGEPFVIDSPGEYSIKGIQIEGIESFHDKEKGNLRGRNTIFIFKTEDLKICHLGDLGHTLSENQIEKLGEIDVLMIPIGGIYTISPKEAEEIVGQLEPKIILPMHYKIKGLAMEGLEDEKSFCSEIGSCIDKNVSKLNIRKKDLDEMENRIILMSVAGN